MTPLVTDVLVIGGGLAALRAAASARECGCGVTVASRGRVAEGGCSVLASGGFAAALQPPDHPDRHFRDSLVGGYETADRRQLHRLAGEAPVRLAALAGSVTGFHEVDGGLKGNPVPAHGAPRSIQYRKGMPHLLKALRNQLEQAGVCLLDDHRCVDLDTAGGGRVRGAWLRARESGAVRCVRAGAVVLASGGCGRLFPVTSNGQDLTGDSASLALRAGCSLRDMEFIQFTPTAFAAPDQVRGRTIVGTLLTISGVTLTNAEGERFLARYDPQRMEQTDRATLARAIAREVMAGRGSPSGGVFLDLRGVAPSELDRHRPGFLDFCRNAGLDPSRDLLQTAPSAHTCLGGVLVDRDLCAMPGLFVAGEAAGGVHGANRLSSNSLTDALVGGWHAGAMAAADATTPRKGPDEAPLLPRSGPGDVDALVGNLRRSMGQAAGVLREGRDIRTGLDVMAGLRCQAGELMSSGVSDLDRWLDLRAMLDAADAVLTASLARRESRGAHFRADHPRRDDANWMGYIELIPQDDMLATRYHAVHDTN